MNLDYNKIWSLINKNNLSKAKAARIAGMSETGFRQMMERKTMAVSTLEKFAEFFQQPIHAFFEETLPPETTVNQYIPVSEGINRYCPGCVENQKEIDQLRLKLIETQEKLNISLEKLYTVTVELHNKEKEIQTVQGKVKKKTD